MLEQSNYILDFSHHSNEALGKLFCNVRAQRSISECWWLNFKIVIVKSVKQML